MLGSKLTKTSISQWILNHSFFQDGRNESKKSYAMIKTDKNLHISPDSQPICTKLSEQGSIFQGSRNEFKKCCPMIKMDKNLNISVDSQLICTKLSELGLFFQGG